MFKSKEKCDRRHFQTFGKVCKFDFVRLLRHRNYWRSQDLQLPDVACGRGLDINQHMPRLPCVHDHFKFYGQFLHHLYQI